jgi:hypothetical protein
MRILKAILFALPCVWGIVPECEAMNPKNYYGLEKELPIIRKAAERNNCNGKLFNILLAIRKAENGGAGFEFGVIAVKGTNLDKQAGWCAATIVKNFQRWKNSGKFEGGVKSFISFLGDRYCPIGAENDPTGLNVNWKRNVLNWYEKFEAEAL